MAKRKSYPLSNPSGRRQVPGHEFSTPAAPALSDRNLLGTSPTSQQFEPTEAMPMRQKHRMAGAG